ncbi:pinin [Striga asiatica]|uniref:Pinin n=1 Tax=Striga asiatica TaxID=4170 RepID=A0A5A7QD83_STRAF|nr:pinin [Striga asiatica]
MYKQSPSRNQRSKRLKLKYVLQICLLLAVCFWLIYQVKHSHDKKREFEELDSKSSLQTKSNNDEILKLGRKDIARLKDEDIIEEDEESKPEDDEPEEKIKTNNEQDNMDDHEQENPDDAEVDNKEEDSADEEIESREVETEGDSVVGENENENESESDDKIMHEAREEQYKADDASSAVTHDARMATENSNEHVENVLEENSIGNGNKTEETNEEDKIREDLDVGGGETGAFDQKSNITNSEANVDVLNESELNHAPPNDTVVEEGFNRNLTGNGSAEVITTERHELALEGTNNSSISNDNSTSNSESKDAEPQSNDGISNNLTGSGETKDGELQSEDFSNSAVNDNDNNTEALLPGQNATLEASVVAENRTENSNSIEPEKEDMSDGSYENSESTGNDNPNEEIQQDGVDLSESDDLAGSVEEKEVRTDLETLPEIQTEGTNNDDDVAAE